MDYDEIESLRRNSPAWRLLRADNGPLVLGFLGRVFVEENIRSISGTELASRLDDELFALNERLGSGTYPKPAKAYLDDWVLAARIESSDRSRQAIVIEPKTPAGEVLPFHQQLH